MGRQTTQKKPKNDGEGQGEGERGGAVGSVAVLDRSRAWHNWFLHCLALSRPVAGTLKALERCVVMNPTSIHEDTGLIPGPAHWVKELWCRSQMPLGSGVAVAVV